MLLHIGTNDILQNHNVAGAPGRLSALIDRITAAAPSADVFVATIIPLANGGQEAAARQSWEQERQFSRRLEAALRDRGWPT